MVRARWTAARVAVTNAAGSWAAAGNRFTKLRLPPVPPIGLYSGRARAAIGPQGVASATVDSTGAATAQAGPQGWGVRWYPQQVTIATETGANDASTCTIYLGSVTPWQIVGQSYAGGGDTVGLAVPEMQPGDFLIAVWAGGNPGDWATMTAIGDQEVPIAG